MTDVQAAAPAAPVAPRFSLIRFVVGTLAVLGVLSLIVGLLALLIAANTNDPGPFTASLVIGLFLAPLWLWFLAGVLYLLLRIEANTAGRRWTHFGDPS